MAGFKVSKPDGTTFEIDKTTLSLLKPDQLAAIVTSLSQQPEKVETDTTTIRQPRILEDIINGGKRERLALFLANNYTHNMVLETADIHRDWMSIVARDNYELYLEKSHISQYLTRLAEMGLITKEKAVGRPVQWVLGMNLFQEYPTIEMDMLPGLLVPAS